MTGKGAETFMVRSASGAYNSANSSTWSTTSDVRIKKNIINATLGLDALNELQVRQFEYRENDEIEDELEKDLPTGKVVTGVIAQEIENVLPETITVRDNGLLTVKTDAEVGRLRVRETAVIQELSDKVDELSTENLKTAIANRRLKWQ